MSLLWFSEIILQGNRSLEAPRGTWQENMMTPSLFFPVIAETRGVLPSHICATTGRKLERARSLTLYIGVLFLELVQSGHVRCAITIKRLVLVEVLQFNQRD